MTVCGHEHEDGAYVLGALSPADRTAFERHLSDCPECQQSVRQLAGLPGLLARVPVEVFDSARLPVPDTLLPSLLRRARRSRRRRSYALAGLAAAVLAVAGIGVAVVTQDDGGAPSAAPTLTPSTAPASPFRPVGAQPISGWVSLTPVEWGTRLDLTCTYAGSGPGYPGKAWTYVMVVTRTDGGTEQVTSWRAVPGKTFHISAGTASTPGEIEDVSIRTEAGRTVLRLR